MESCHSVNYTDNQLISPPRNPCHLPVYSTLGHLIKIIEKLRNRDYAVPDIDNGLRWLEREQGRNRMEGISGTGQSKQLSTVIGTLELELRKLQQSNESLAQENISQHQSIKALEQRLKPLNEKNRRFLEKNMELTTLTRNLKDQLQSSTEDNKKLKDQCEHCKKKIKQLTQQLHQEKLEKGTLELQTQNLLELKQKCTDQEKALTALKLSVQEKDRRIELVQHRKRKKKSLRPHEKGVKETFYGYDEEDTSLSSDISLSLSTGTLSDEELCEELSRSEMEKNYQKLMKEHLELQRLHAILTSQCGTNLDPQRELKLRVDLETNLFQSQCQIEKLTTELTDTHKRLTAVETKKSEMQEKNIKLTEKVKQLELDCCRLREKLDDSRDLVETLEFQVMEYETDNVGALETIPEDPAEMNGGEHASRKTVPSSEFDAYVESLESSVQDLQSKVSRLQQENASLKERPISVSPSLEEREAQEVMTLKDSHTPNSHSHQHALTTQSSPSQPSDLVESHNDQLSVGNISEQTHTAEIIQSQYDQSNAGDINQQTHISNIGNHQDEEVSLENSNLEDKSDSEITEDSYESLEMSQDVHMSPTHDITICTAEILALRVDLKKSQDEVLSLRSQLEEKMTIKEDILEENADSFEMRLEEMRQVCVALQDRVYQAETAEKQLKEKLKLAEYTINDLESSENSARENLEICRKSEVECKKSLSNCQNKIRELKEIILDKDVSEMNLAEKVQFLEKAEEIASQKISDLEMQNQLLEQRLQLKEELETDIMLVKTLKDQIKDLEMENKDLTGKVAELEENEEILKINWMKVAENDAERIQSFEEKVHNLELLNLDLRKRLREQREKSDPPNAPSLATELSESEKSMDGNSLVSLQQKVKSLQEELAETEEKKNSQIEKLQDKIATLRENEIKLSETLAEMEHTERELRNRVSMYEQSSSSDRIKHYEGKIREMHRSREDLLDRMDSMEEHEGDLKKRLKELEEQHEWKVEQLEKKVELMEREIAQYIQQEEDLTSRIMEIEKHEDELMEKVNKYEGEVKLLEQQLEESEGMREELEQEGERLSEEVNTLQKENQDLQENLESVSEELEQIRVENNDLNERVIELDSYEQECEEKMKAVETKSSLLEEANCKLMDRVTELESLEIELRSKPLSSSVNMKSDSSEEKSTDTDDLNAPKGRKLTGMFERLQDLESENQIYSEQLVTLQGADVQNKKLNEKVKLLENSEEKLMERVMELEDREDFLMKENQKLRNSVTFTEVPDIMKEVADLRETVELLKVNLEMLKGENEEYKEQLNIAEETIQSLQNELSVHRTEMEVSETKVTEMETSLKSIEDSLVKEKQCVQDLRDCERSLSVKLDEERSRSEKLECELSEVNLKMRTMEREYESKISELNETLSSQLVTVSDLENSLSQFKHNEEEHSRKISELTEENNALLKVMKMKTDVNCDSECEDTFVQDKENQLKLNQIATPISAQSTPIKSDVNPSAKTELISDISNIDLSDEKKCAKCFKLNQKLSEQLKKESILVENLTTLKKEFQAKEKSSKTLCSKCQEMFSNFSPSVLSEDSFFGLNKTEEFNKKMQTLQKQCDEQSLRVREKALGCRVKELEDELEEFRRVLQDIVLDIQIRFHDEIQEVDDEVPRTFQLPSDLPVVLNPEIGKVLENLVHCVDCLTKTKDKFSSGNEETSKKIEALLLSEKSLKQQVQDLQEQLANNNNGAEIRDNPAELLSKVTELEAVNRELEVRLESSIMSERGLESPEDVFRQRISELERLEKHLKHQVSDLEKDREELHEIARKDKNTIHEQNIRIRELQLSEKNMKEQLNRLDASEQSLFNKVEEQEDQITKMEDRISELKIMEMRLKELVRKYKLDEEVWLSKSANLNETLSELSTSEAHLKQQLENLEKEKLNLSEKSEYLEERLKEVEKAEANLLQRTKDQENQEISLNKKLSDMQTMGSNAEKQLSELHNANIELSQQLNHVMQDNMAISHHMTQLQNQLAVLDQQNVSLHADLEKVNKDKSSLQSSGKSLDKELENSKIKEVELEGKLRQKEESEELLKEKIGNLQRSENRLKYRIQQLESGSQVISEVSPSQREKLPRKLEDCQRRIVVLQNRNEQLCKKLTEYQNPEANFVNVPGTELRRLKARDVLLDQSEAELHEVEKLNSHLQKTVEQLRNGKDACGHEVEVETLKNRLHESNRTIVLLKELLEEGQIPMGLDINEDILKDHSVPSPARREGPGHLAERRVKDQRSIQSNVIGRPVQELADQLMSMNKGRQPLHDQSDAGHMNEEMIPKEVQGLHEKNPYSSMSNDDRQRRVNDFVSRLEKDELFSPREEAHWRQVESRVPHAPDSERWIHVGKATSLHSSVPNQSHPSNEELVLGLTLPSESESQQFTQNDTDSSGNSPAVKRRKFRPVNGTEPHLTPSSIHGLNNFDAPYYMPAVNHDSMGGEPEMQYLMEEYRMMSPPIRIEDTAGSIPDSGHGTTSVGTTSAASTGKSQLSLKEKIAEIGKSLQKHPLSCVSDLSDDEDSLLVWKSKASDSSRRLEDAEKESKYLKQEINKLEKDVERKARYILILEDFIEKLKSLLEMKDSKPDRELVQILEAELIKTLEELQDSGCQKLELNQDPVALNTELAKKDRELTAKTHEVDGLMRELRQWQEECRLVEDMRTNALDSLRCLELEVSDLHTTEKDLKVSKEAYNKLQEQYSKLKLQLRDLELVEIDRNDLRDQVNRLERELMIAAELRSEVDISEGKLDHMTSVLQNRTEKIQSLIEEISTYKSKIVSLERENMNVHQSLASVQGVHTRCHDLEAKNEQVLLSVTPLKTKLARLMQKCREKDDLLRKLGVELRKLKMGGGPGSLLQELALMEQRMPSEEYNVLDEGSPQQANHLSRHSVSMIDLQRSRSNSSVSDSQDHIAHSDTEMATPIIRRSNHHTERRQRLLPPSTHSPRLPHIQGGQMSPSYGSPNESLPVGHMPPDPLFIAVANYDPLTFSRSHRPSEELRLQEWDKVTVKGPLDDTGYYLAEVNGKTGLVPAAYLRPASLADQRNGRWKGIMGQKPPAYLDASPERIVETHYQLQQSQNRNGAPLFPRINGHVPELSPLFTRNSSTSARTSEYPDPPKDFRVEKVINRNTLMLAWTPPKFTENNQNRGVKCTGYKIYLNGQLHQQASSPHIAKTIVKNVDTRQRQAFSIQTIGSGGQCSDVVETVHNAPVTGDLEGPEENPSAIRSNEVYSSSHKRMFVGVYDFVPSPGKHGRLELPFQAGERILVYGEERVDGFYYGEINGRRGLVPGFFIEEIPHTLTDNS